MKKQNRTPIKLHKPVTKEMILEFLKELDASITVSDDGEHLLPNGMPACGCTGGAMAVAERFGGKVMGFYADDNPAATIGEGYDGHDFAIVGYWLVDPWAHYVENFLECPVLDLHRDDALIEKLYGPREKWVEVPL